MHRWLWVIALATGETSPSQLMGPVAVDENVAYALPLDPRDPIDGPADAKVTIVAVFEWMDPAMPRLVAMLDEVRAKHPADVRIAWRYLAVHAAPALPAGLLSCAAGAAGVWPAVRGKLLATLYTPDGHVHPERGGLEQLRPIVVGAGLSTAAIDAADVTCHAWIAGAPKQLGALGLRTPPSVVVNGRVLAGLPDALRLANVVAEELATATQRIAGGVPAASYYQGIVDKAPRVVKGRFED
ncbi:MAG: hypothetical protein NT062_14205 [Proteobacteria bacterium]|nr:hypothetical protein [Pseudomonadota bacterium]